MLVVVQPHVQQERLQLHVAPREIKFNSTNLVMISCRLQKTFVRTTIPRPTHVPSFWQSLMPPSFQGLRAQAFRLQTKLHSCRRNHLPVGALWLAMSTTILGKEPSYCLLHRAWPCPLPRRRPK